MSRKYIANTFQTPNFVIDELYGVLPDSVLLLYQFIIRKTVGWNKESDRIPIREFMEASGKARSTVGEMLNELEMIGLIRKYEDSGKTTEYEPILQPDLDRAREIKTERKARYQQKKIDKENAQPIQKTVPVQKTGPLQKTGGDPSGKLEGTRPENWRGPVQKTGHNKTPFSKPPFSKPPFSKPPFSKPTGEGGKPSPFDEFANPDDYPVFVAVAYAWRAHGNGEVKPRDIALYRKHVAQISAEGLFVKGAQNYLNDKSAQRGARYKNLDTFIREEGWRMEQPVKAGAIHIPGAPAPPTEHQATGQRVADIVNKDPLKVVNP